MTKDRCHLSVALRCVPALGAWMLVLTPSSAAADDAPLLPPVTPAPAAPSPSPPPIRPSVPIAPSPPPPPGPPPGPKPLDISDPPFSGDFSWLNGSNRQPESLLKVGPVVMSLYVDAFYAWQFSQPVDHTIFPTTTAPRHNELGFNLASLGIELPANAIDTATGGPIGQLSLQYGAITQAVGGQDTTVNRGFFLSNTALQLIRTASAGWHFHFLHGVNLEFGIFPSYVGMESYLPQENWNYTHPFLSDFTPYYFYGGRAQLYLTAKTKLELWVVNGWQTYGQWQEAKSGGYLWNWRPNERFSVSNVLYIGQTSPDDSGAIRYYTDTYAELQYFKRPPESFFTSSAVCLVADFGYQARTSPSPSGPMTGVSLTDRTEFGTFWAVTFRGDMYYDETRAVTTTLPVGSPYTLRDATKAFLGGGFATTLDFLPSPWLIWRLEYIHRAANVPFFSGHGGITGNGPDGQVDPLTVKTFVPDLRQSDDRIVANVTLRL